MNSSRSASWAGLPRLLYNHNPFYVISALFVLYGIYRAMPADSNVGGGWLLLGLLAGYTVVLALTGFVIIRFGRVWNDARTILLTIVLLFVAMSTIFDQIVLDSPTAGARLLLLGLTFAIAVSEGMLRSLKLRLALRYRGPYYLMLVLLFCYPLLLGQLSKLGQAERMPLFVALFPVLGGLAMLTLLPAAHGGDLGQLPLRHPWRWPAYPWSLFVVLLVAMALRSYSFSHGFESGHFGQSSFQPFFLLPLLLAGAAVFLELAITAKNKTACAVALIAPAGLLGLALPGRGLNPVAGQFLAELSTKCASPIQLTIAALATFYVIAWIRGLRLGEAGFVACIAVFAIVDSRTIDFGTFRSPHCLPLASIAVLELAAGLWFRTSWRHMLAASFGLAALSSFDWFRSSASHEPFEPWAVIALCVILLGAICDDWWARQMRRFAWPLIPLVATAAVSRCMADGSNTPRPAQAAYLACLTILAFVYWYRAPALKRFAGAALSAAIFAAAMGRWLYLDLGLERSRLADGLPWITWGAAALGLAMFVSFAKAGVVATAIGRLQRFGCNVKPVATFAPHKGNNDDH